MKVGQMVTREEEEEVEEGGGVLYFSDFVMLLWGRLRF